MGNNQGNRARRDRVPIFPLRLQTIARMRRKLKAEGDCLVFTGSRNKAGYGFVDVMVKGARRPILAHRLAWAWEHQREPAPGKIICHRCNNPSCCNPKHLYEGTPLTNSQDAVKAGHMGKGKPWLGKTGAAHPCSHKPETRAAVIEILDRDLAAGRGLNFSHSGIAALGVGRRTAATWWRASRAA